MDVSGELEIPPTPQKLSDYLKQWIRPADIDHERTLDLKKPYTVQKSEPCVITGVSSTASSRVAILEVGSDQTLLLKYLRSLRTIGLRFRLGHPSNVVIVRSNLQKYLSGRFPTLVLTLSDTTLNKLIKLLSSDNKYRELQWKEGSLQLDPYRSIMSLSKDFNDSMFQLVLLDPSRFSRECLTVHNPITNSKGVYVASSDGYLRESPGSTDRPIIPPMPFYEGRPRAAHRSNPFYVALSSAFIFLHYQSDPIRFNGIPEKARALLSKTLRVKELLEWKLRTEQGTVPPRREFIGSMADLSLWTTGDHAKIAEDDEDQSDANPVEFCLAKVSDEYLKEYLNTASEAYVKTKEEEEAASETDDEYSDEEEAYSSDSIADMRSGAGKETSVADCHLLKRNSSEDPQQRQERLEALERFLRDDAQSGKRYLRKEITNLQYGIE